MKDKQEAGCESWHTNSKKLHVCSWNAAVCYRILQIKKGEIVHAAY
jgi:hypothetical protein